MAFTINKDHKIMELLEVTELRHLIAHTNKGELTLMLRKGETSYRFVLDAVPVEPNVHRELMDLLYPVPTMQVPQVNKDSVIQLMIEPGKIIPMSVKSKGGRPKGSKNINKLTK